MQDRHFGTMEEVQYKSQQVLYMHQVIFPEAYRKWNSIWGHQSLGQCTSAQWTTLKRITVKFKSGHDFSPSVSNFLTVQQKKLNMSSLKYIEALHEHSTLSQLKKAESPLMDMMDFW